MAVNALICPQNQSDRGSTVAITPIRGIMVMVRQQLFGQMTDYSFARHLSPKRWYQAGNLTSSRASGRKPWSGPGLSEKVVWPRFSPFLALFGAAQASAAR
jgi:hypothetical protein